MDVKQFCRSKAIGLRSLLLSGLLMLCLIDISAQTPLKVNIKCNDKVSVDYDKKYLLAMSPDDNETDTLNYNEGLYYPKQMFPSSGSYICIPQKGLRDISSAEDILKRDGVIYCSWLPEYYAKAMTEPSCPLLGFTNRTKEADLFVPTGFICVNIGANGKKYDNLNIKSTSTPLGGWMIFDGSCLHPSQESVSDVNISLSSQPSEVYIPVVPDYPFNFEMQLTKGTGAVARKDFENIKVGRGEVITLYFRPSGGIVPDSIPRPQDRPLPKKEKKDSLDRDCDFTRKMSVELLAKILWERLGGENKWAPKQKKNWNTALPIEQWAGISKNSNGLYDIDIRSGFNMDIAAGIAAKILDDPNFECSKNSPAVDPSAAPIRNRPCGDKAEFPVSITIDGCQELRKLVLMCTGMTELIIKNCENLEGVELIGNSLERLNIICCPNLTTVSASVNRLKELGIRRCPEVRTLFCPGNFIEELKLEELPQLEDLNCAVNLLDRLNVSRNENLKDLRCFYNLIKRLDLSNVNSLETLMCAGNNYIQVSPSLDVLKSRGLTRYNISGRVKLKGMSDF